MRWFYAEMNSLPPEDSASLAEPAAGISTPVSTVQADRLDEAALALKVQELAISKRQSTYRFVEVVFGTLVLGIVGVAFNWANFRREGATEDRKFLADHLTIVMQEKDPRARRKKIADLIAIRDGNRSVLEEKYKEAEADVVVEDSEKKEQQRLQQEAAAAKSAEEKKQAEIRLATAKAKAAKEKAAREKERRDSIDRIRDGGGHDYR
jgi:septal ring factor EnvC (AmiA/AmiB activator)